MKLSTRLTAPLMAAFLTFAASAQDQIQTTGEPGAPNSTTTIDGKQLPPPNPAFGGFVKENASAPAPATGSTPYWPPRVVPRNGAPNVLLIMTDDLGFGAPSTFGGVIPTPALDRIAKAGLRYTQFHSTALCSPTRAALLTGRNHHSTGNGVVAEMSSGYEGYNSIIPKNMATIGTILKNSGYSTSWFGKDHLTPSAQKSQAGPFDQWPCGMGFDYFYGFVCGDSNQWQPNLFRNTTQVDPSTDPRMATPGWNLTTAMADDAIGWLNQLNQLSPDKPFFCHYVPGGTHAPHHPTQYWIDRIHKMKLFDEGWNKLRETIFANQVKLGVVPPDARLTPWPSEKEWADELLPKNARLPEWDSASEDPDAKALYLRQAEVFAAYVAYTDHEIGRVIQAVEDMGKLDNTLIIYISGDNGCSAEGGVNGTMNESTYFNGVHVTVKDQMKWIPDWGSDKTYPHMACEWAWAFNTPFKWTKQVASHFGGTRQGMCISWPGHITDVGGIRNQFHHVVDILPTILEATGITAPALVNGISQQPIAGVSMAYTFPKESQTKPSTRTRQYFEIQGLHGIYDKGWYACTTPVSAPWAMFGDVQEDPANGYNWELYDITKDWTQHDDLAAANPEKVKEMQNLFMEEAHKYQVLPLNANPKTLMSLQRPSLSEGRNDFRYTQPLAGIPYNAGPKLINTSYTINADIKVSEDGGQGVIMTSGGRFSGWGLYLLEGKPVFTWNLSGMEYAKWEAKEKLAPGRNKIEFSFTYNGAEGESGKSGEGFLAVNGVSVDTKKMDKTQMFSLPPDEFFDVGSDTGTPVCDADYSLPFPFTGKIHEITVKLTPPASATQASVPPGDAAEPKIKIAAMQPSPSQGLVPPGDASEPAKIAAEKPSPSPSPKPSTAASKAGNRALTTTRSAPASGTASKSGKGLRGLFGPPKNQKGTP